MTQRTDPNSLTPLLHEAMHGEETRGSDGVVYYNKAENIVRYMKIHEIQSEELQERVADIVTDEGRDYYFVLEEIERVMHIWKIPKHAAMQRAIQHIDGEDSVNIRAISATSPS